MRRLNPTILAVAAIGVITLLIIIAMVSKQGNSAQDRLTEDQINPEPAARPEGRCAFQATYDRIKRELFRQAAQLRKSDQGAFDQISAAASVRMERPVMTEHDEKLGTIRCTGYLALDLPPGMVVVGGRRSLAADVDYVLQPAADGSGDVVIIEGADSITIPLATLARTRETVAPPAISETVNEVAPYPAPAEDSVVAEPVVVPMTPPTAQPSFNCRHARTRGEIAVCRNPSLAGLDRQMASQYYRAIAAADRRQRAILTATRDSFLRYRDRCSSDDCIAETYRGRMREIRDIMSGEWRPGR